MKIDELQAPNDKLFSEEDIDTVINIVVNHRWKEPMTVEEFLNRHNKGTNYGE